jgi:hypothetical protein
LWSIRSIWRETSALMSRTIVLVINSRQTTCKALSNRIFSSLRLRTKRLFIERTY